MNQPNPYARQRLQDHIFLNLLAIATILTILGASWVIRDSGHQAQYVREHAEAQR